MTSRFVDGPAGRLHLTGWEASGASSAAGGTLPLLLVHGMGAHTHWWDLVAPLLAPRRSVRALDLRGHGESTWAEPPRYAIDDYAADIEAARRGLGWERFLLVGHSLGARASIRYARDYPARLAGLAALDFLAAFRPERDGRFERQVKRRQPTYSDAKAMAARFHLQPPGTLLGPEALARLARHGIRSGPDGRWSWKFDWRAFYFEYTPIWDDAAAVRVPALVMRGEHSRVMPAEDYAQALSAFPRARGVELPGAYHHIPLDAPGAVAAGLEEFAASLSIL